MGAAGRAVFELEMSKTLKSPIRLADADILMQRCRADEGKDGSYYVPELGLTDEVFGDTSVWNGPVGRVLAELHISVARCDEYVVGLLLDRICQWPYDQCAQVDTTLGTAGVLLNLAILGQELRALGNEGHRARADEVGARLRSTIVGYLERHEDADFTDLVRVNGVAHGWAGLAYAVAAWDAYRCSAVSGAALRRAERLLSYEQRTAIGSHYRIDRKDRYNSSWCNGSAGYVFLWTLLSAITGRKEFSDAARRAAEFSYYSGSDASIRDLCCGLAGRAYALLAVYHSTREELWRERASELVGHCHSEGTFLKKDSLYKGRLGPHLLATQLEANVLLPMPFFEYRGVE
jgi:serine/threonine-protein kinase